MTVYDIGQKLEGTPGAIGVFFHCLDLWPGDILKYADGYTIHFTGTAEVVGYDPDGNFLTKVTPYGWR